MLDILRAKQFYYHWWVTASSLQRKLNTQDQSRGNKTDLIWTQCISFKVLKLMRLCLHLSHSAQGPQQFKICLNLFHHKDLFLSYTLLNKNGCYDSWEQKKSVAKALHGGGLKKVSHDLKQNHSMYNNKLQKNNRKSKAVRAKISFIWESWRLKHSNLHGHTSFERK